MSSLRVVACGGGHGLAASLAALRHLTERLTAVVTVADDGGSSGRLREELGVLPPGDLRMALAALCDDTEWGRTWRDVLQHRFASDGPLHDHAVGNLLIVALWQRLGDAVEGLDLVARLLGARGRVLPMSSVPLAIEADVALGHRRGGGEGAGAPAPPGPRVVLVRGQAQVATTSGRVLEVRLDPAEPPARPEAVAAVREADWVVLGPGSWFTSVIPHLLVPELRAALVGTAARRALVLNLSAPRGESRGLTPAQHVRALAAHAPTMPLDAVLADPRTLAGGEDGEQRADLEAAVRDAGGQLLLRRLAAGRDPVHDPLRLATAFRDVFDVA
ncbi:MAG: FIG002813: LPPG:FO 2-phospho-L-lactate transferase like, CofD-like [uncultured Quadrisphaera sp.]|uniref:Putative gluconeogenesis factor n=1 Tax=uncultured Quadrisphaera sp. TaxID=904978 RepID=A0A6J4Q7I5_9ACTN|nr:MAG: FIG002813: LPPG:FO 2-phospho-L-lactate transferase like, CofD-like [uncultured Quadrisphaera sp.]